MSVKDILTVKGQQVHCLGEASPLREAIHLMNSKNIGAVLILDEQEKITGILSERDIVRRALAQETGFRDEPVSKTMTSTVKTVTPDTEIDVVMDIMTTKRIRHIPVVDGDTLVGLVSIGDVVKRKITDAEKEAEVLREYISTG